MQTEIASVGGGLPGTPALLRRIVVAGLLLLSLVAGPASVLGSAPSQQVLESRLVGTPASGTRHLETWLAGDPADPERMIATTVAVGTPGSSVYASGDGGATWQPARHEGGTLFPGGDPMAVFARDGVAWFTTIESRAHLWRSVDGGMNWERMPDLPGGTYDRQFLAAGVDSQHPYLLANGKIVGLQVFDAPLTTSRDVLALTWSEDGTAFREPRRMLPLPGQRLIHAPIGLLATRDGRVLIPYVAFPVPDEVPLTVHGKVAVTLSDADRAFTTSRDIGDLTAVSNAGDPVRAAMGLAVGGVTQDVGDGPRAGRIYVTWDTLVDDHLVVQLAASDDGVDWEPAITVHPPGMAGDQVNPAVAVNRDGDVGLVWNDFGIDPDGACYVPVFAVSRDGGATFSPPLRLVQGPTCPAAPDGPVDDPDRLLANGKIDPESPAARWVNGGDTQGLLALPDGSFAVAWPNGEGGRVPSLWYTRVGLR